MVRTALHSSLTILGHVFLTDSDVRGCDVYVVGENPYGEVQSGTLRLRGRLARARVSYTFHRRGGDWITDSTHQHDPLRYELHKHHTRVGTIELPFFADYILTADGRGHIEDKSDVRIFKAIVNLFLALKSTGRNGEFKRIGLFKAPAAYHELYGVDLIYQKSEDEVEISII